MLAWTKPSAGERIMVIDCHGHYTTAPRQLEAFRQNQIAGWKDASRAPASARLDISDEEIRESLQLQLTFQRERGTDLTIFSPRAAGMGHHIGDAAVSLAWSEICNDLIHRCCTLYPDNFVAVCQLPQSPGVPPKHCVAELERCVKSLGFVGCNLNPDPSGGHCPRTIFCSLPRWSARCAASIRRRDIISTIPSATSMRSPGWARRRSARFFRKMPARCIGSTAGRRRPRVLGEQRPVSD